MIVLKNTYSKSTKIEGAFIDQDVAYVPGKCVACTVVLTDGLRTLVGTDYDVFGLKAAPCHLHMMDIQLRNCLNTIYDEGPIEDIVKRVKKQDDFRPNEAHRPRFSLNGFSNTDLA